MKFKAEMKGKPSVEFDLSDSSDVNVLPENLKRFVEAVLTAWKDEASA